MRFAARWPELAGSRALWAAALALHAPLAAAQEQTRLDTLTVTAEPAEAVLPLSVSHIDATAQLAPSPRSLFDVLSLAPGVFALNRNNAAQGLRVAIRGFGARAAFGVRGIRVSLDGIPLTAPDGQTELDALDLALLGGASIVRGPAASLYGNAAGGVIELSSRPIESTGGELSLLQERYDTRRVRGEASAVWQDTRLRGSLAVQHADGPRAHSHTDSRIGRLQLEQMLVGGELRLMADWLDIHALDPGALTAADRDADRRAASAGNLRFDAGETITQGRLAATWQQSGPVWNAVASGFFARRDFANRLPFERGGQASFERDFGGLGLIASSTRDWLGIAQRVSVGLDVQSQSDERRRHDNLEGVRGALRLNQRERAEVIGVFLRDALSVSPHWDLSLGLRHDWLRLAVDDRYLDDGDDSGRRRLGNASGDVSLSRWQGAHGLHLRWASAYETPTFNELANPAGGGFNPDLDASRTQAYEAGYRFQEASLQAAVVVYDMRSSDELLSFQLEDQPGRNFFRNAGRTSRRGVELDLVWALDSHWSLSGALTASRARFDQGDNRGRQLPGLPERFAQLGLHHQRGRWGLSLSTLAIGRYFADDANSLAVPGYALFNLRGRFELGAAELSLGVDNLLDRDYDDNVRLNAFGGRAFEPAGGRTWRAGLAWNW